MQIGRYTLDENGYSIHGKLIRDPFKMLPSVCPNLVECKKMRTTDKQGNKQFGIKSVPSLTNFQYDYNKFNLQHINNVLKKDTFIF